ncbi:hypothetical protein [Paenibacillus rhizophilus]|uniref:Uncharacterized protein n=1 Tax=Paenibacillus rhizophilus TaxID=1850366 RepID=A0A3N9P0P7_9BACL|nr:hypothetical protein [Paenibacillus rhizophilus]RQW08714.1 hypothetical protein EH198_21415 [Paenibacillus rhizophilus]
MEIKPYHSVGIIRRLTYYAAKLNDYSQQRYDYLLRRIDKQPPASRIMRLQTYKSLMHEQITRGGN